MFDRGDGARVTQTYDGGIFFGFRVTLQPAYRRRFNVYALHAACHLHRFLQRKRRQRHAGFPNKNARSNINAQQHCAEPRGIYFLRLGGKQFRDVGFLPARRIVHCKRRYHTVRGVESGYLHRFLQRKRRRRQSVRSGKDARCNADPRQHNTHSHRVRFRRLVNQQHGGICNLLSRREFYHKCYNNVVCGVGSFYNRN